MRKFLTSLGFFIPVFSIGQQVELQGMYGASFIGAESIEFTGKDSFYFSGFYCTYGVHGRGRCEIRNNYLYLYFEKSGAAEGRIRAPEITATENADSTAILNITCEDSSGNPIPHVTVQLKRKNRMVTESMSTNGYGKASFAIKKNHLPVTIRTLSADYTSNPVSVTAYSGYYIRIFHKRMPFDNLLDNGEVFVYEIEELSEDLISMRPEHSKGRFIKYRKK